MTLTEETLRFIREHRNDDVRSLALQTHRYPMVDMPAAITQIAGHQAAKGKIPTWADVENILYPAHLSLEQCSSETTARHKAEMICTIARKENATVYDNLTDLTGGFGIDCAFLSSCFKQVTYVERQVQLCQIASHNFPLLGLTQISVCHDDGISHLQQMQPVDWIFIDPARRDSHGGKAVAIGDCEPDVSVLEDLLLEKARHVFVKLSPMLDLTLALNDLKHVQEAHIVSVNNECKELLLVLGHGESLSADEVPIHCINLGHGTDAGQGINPPALVFTRRKEKEQAVPHTTALKAYLYEPNASILKAGAFRSICASYKVEKLHPNSHLYTSDQYLAHFPGRKFKITGSCGFNKKEVKEMVGAEKKANLTVRNFPATVAELRKRMKLAEGGETYLFATTLGDEKKVLIRCRNVSEK